jgi:transposase InsO family protein
MGQVLHGSARTTEAVRRAIQHCQASLRALAKRYGINQKTVRKWKARDCVADLRTGPKEPRSTVLSVEEEAIVIAFRHTLLPLDDCLYALQATIPHLTRSSLHRCLQRHGLSRLPEVEGDNPEKKRFKSYLIGFFHIDLAEVRTEEGKLYLYVAVDRTSKFAFVQLVEKANTVTARAFLDALVAAVPYKIEIVLTDNGIQFADLPKNRSGPTAMFRGHPFDRACRSHGIEHRLTKPNHPWTTDVIDKSFLRPSEVSSCGARVTAWRRAGRKVQALPRSPIVAPLLRRLCPPSALAGSSRRQSGHRPSRPARPSAALHRDGS